MKGIKVLLLVLVFGVSSLSVATVKVVCIKSARAGQDQKLAGRYHVSYSTADDYHCYFAFDKSDVDWISLREARNKYPDLAQGPYLPSYQGYLVYFKNDKPYKALIEGLRKKGKTLGQIRSLLATVKYSVAIHKSAKEAKEFLTEDL